ncbi:MAG TPA: YceH family protein [Terriglobales bacterium]|nr:YceH family protein [Terriglobales bacterium]
MQFELTGIEARVLGSLAEKETTTPDYYPLSLNALVNACNQKSNRDPVMNVDEDAVRDALDSLSGKGLATAASSAESRVTKYEHRLQEVFNFTRGEAAIMCALLLRGPQTPGELRGHTERMYQFAELADVQSTLQRLMQREEPLVHVLPRQPGTKEARYMHLLSGENVAQAPQTTTEVSPADVDRISRLEDTVQALQSELADVKAQLAAFRRQFE